MPPRPLTPSTCAARGSDAPAGRSRRRAEEADAAAERFDFPRRGDLGPDGLGALRDEGRETPRLDGLEEKVFLARADPQRFGKRLRPLYESPDVDLYLDASVTELETAPDRAGVTGARLRTSEAAS